MLWWTWLALSPAPLLTFPLLSASQVTGSWVRWAWNRLAPRVMKARWGQGTRLEVNTLWEDANIGCVIFLSTSTMPPSYGPILHWMSPVQAAHPSRWGQNCRAEDHNHNSQSHSVHDDRNDQQSSHGGRMGAHIWEEGRDGRLVPVQ